MCLKDFIRPVFFSFVCDIPLHLHLLAVCELFVGRLSEGYIEQKKTEGNKNSLHH